MKKPNKAEEIRRITTITEVVAWCMRTGDTFPLEDGLKAIDGWGRVKNNFPEETAFGWEETHWFNVNKSLFAEYCGVKPSQVSRWIRAGMPVRNDGRLDWWRADEWLERYERECKKRQDDGWQE